MVKRLVDASKLMMKLCEAYDNGMTLDFKAGIIEAETLLADAPTEDDRTEEVLSLQATIRKLTAALQESENAKGTALKSIGENLESIYGTAEHV